MQYRKIANTDLEVSAVSLGTWVFGGDCWGEVDDAVSGRVIEDAVDNGINFIDTAPVYGSGRAEKVVGQAIQNKRDKLVIATKCGLQQKGSSIKPNLSASFIREEIENSLRRLNIETVDLYQCHFPDAGTPLEETFGELKELVKEGKVRYIGVSNFGHQLLEGSLSLVPVASDQVQYSLLDRSIEQDLIPFCNEKNISILSYGSLGGGILTGKYKTPPALSKGDVKSFFYKYYKEPFWGKAKQLVECLRGVAGKRGAPVSQAAINWVLVNRAVASCIVGSRTPEQLQANINVTDWKLSEEELAEIQKEYNSIFS